MKKSHLFLFVTITMLIALNSLLLTAKQADRKNTQTSTVSNTIPEDLKGVFKKSCMACHAPGGNGMAMAHVNFSNWDNYSSKKQANKSEAICNVITKGTMPPKSFIKSNPDAALTEMQKEAICKWSASIKK